MLKVSCFITRDLGQGTELLLIKHPYAGNQIPAGTVESGEKPEEAALREAVEETNLEGLVIAKALGITAEVLPKNQGITTKDTTVYARPDLSSFDWATLRSGIRVMIQRKEQGFSQVIYEEFDRLPDPQYITYSIKGWVPDDVLSQKYTRHFFHLTFNGDSPITWTVSTDNHHFMLFWAPLEDLPPLIPPQDGWLHFFFKEGL